MTSGGAASFAPDAAELQARAAACVRSLDQDQARRSQGNTV